jgi:hypothetical protein
LGKEQQASSAPKDAPVEEEGRKLQKLLATQLSCQLDRADVCPVKVFFLSTPRFLVARCRFFLGLRVQDLGFRFF